MKPTDAPPHPADWSTATVKSAVEVKRGVSWSKDQEHDAPRDGAVPVLRIGNVQERLTTDDLLYISGLPKAAAEKQRVSEGWTLIVGSNGNRDRIGNAVFIRETTEYLFASFLLAARPREGCAVTPGFFYRWLTSDQVQSYLSASAEGTTGLNNLSHSFFRAMTMSFPSSVEEQGAIVAVLDALDEATDRVLDAVERSRIAARALTQRLLTIGVRGEKCKKTVLGVLPESWEVVNVGAVVTNFQYGLSMPMQAQGCVPILRMGNIQDGNVQLDDLKYVTLPDEVLAAYLVRRGDVLFNRTNSQEHIGKVGIYRCDDPAVFASYLIRLNPQLEVVDPYFLGHVLSSYPAQCRIKRYATPGVQQVNVNATNLGRVLIPLPSGDHGLAEQREIAGLLEEASTKTKRYAGILSSLRELKRSLASDLLTGTVRYRTGSEVTSRHD
jgi:type I restriction enzyme, S subunit